MFASTRDFLRGGLLLAIVSLVACATGEAPLTSTVTNTGGQGGDDLGPCGMDCATVKTAQCTVSVCNTGQVVGPLNACVVVPSPAGTACDDGLFCTTDDACNAAGACVGGAQNDCGLPTNECTTVLCYEDSKKCESMPANEAGPCVPTDLCEVEGLCHVGECLGKPRDCGFSPLNECNTVVCDPADGKCKGKPDSSKDDTPCVLTGDLCRTNKTCKAGACGGGVEKDCSALDVGCIAGVCDPGTGICGQATAPSGSPCYVGIPACHNGTCDAKGDCQASPAPDGSPCNDHDSCTKGDTCQSGVCDGAPVPSCSVYFTEGFEVCPHGWTLAGDWECGTPKNVGPPTAHTGSGVIATKIAGVYSVNQGYTTNTADSPSINLTQATRPVLSFWAWDFTEGGTFDGWNLKVSTNGGQSFTQVTTVDPPYGLTIATQPAWGGDHSLAGWQPYTADLTPYIGHNVILRFSFRSDGATVHPGVYLDDLVVAEPLQSPLFVTTPSQQPDVYVGQDAKIQAVRVGGTGASAWSILPGGVNAGWLAIDPVSGLVTGKATAAQVGPVSFTVHVEEPQLPSNFAERTFTFNVLPDVYYTSFESCPGGWTLTGDWQCGVPTGVGPATAYVGTQCLATRIAGNYSDLQSYGGTTATSPEIDLTNTWNPTVTFRMWVDTEGADHDGFNLWASEDGGATFQIVDTVTPPYGPKIGGQPAWGAHQALLGWQFVQAALVPYGNKKIRLRFAFRSDSSGNFPGVYIDDVLVQ